jgi:hypothetical protein
LMAGVERQRRGHRWATLNSRCGDVDSVVMIAAACWAWIDGNMTKEARHRCGLGSWLGARRHGRCGGIR